MPIAVLFIPFIDLVLAVVRRTRARPVAVLAGQDAPAPPAARRSGTRTAAPCWSCTSGRRCSSFGAVALSITGGRAELLVAIGVLLVVGVVVVLSPRARRAAREARAAELAAQRERSRAEHPTARALRLGAPARPPAPGPAPPPAGRPAGGPVTPAARRSAPWDLSFLRVGALVTRRGRGGRGAPVAGLLAGWADAARRAGRRRRRHGVLLRLRRGHRLGRPDRRHASRCPAALGTFFVKALVLFARAERAARGRLAGPAHPRLGGRRRRAAVERGPAALGLDPAAVLRAPAGTAGAGTRTDGPADRGNAARHAADSVRCDGRGHSHPRGLPTTTCESGPSQRQWGRHGLGDHRDDDLRDGRVGRGRVAARPLVGHAVFFPVGIIFGMAVAIYLVVARYGAVDPPAGGSAPARPRADDGRPDRRRTQKGQR